MEDDVVDADLLLAEDEEPIAGLGELPDLDDGEWREISAPGSEEL